MWKSITLQDKEDESCCSLWWMNGKINVIIQCTWLTFVSSVTRGECLSEFWTVIWLLNSESFVCLHFSSSFPKLPFIHPCVITTRYNIPKHTHQRHLKARILRWFIADNHKAYIVTTVHNAQSVYREREIGGILRISIRSSFRRVTSSNWPWRNTLGMKRNFFYFSHPQSFIGFHTHFVYIEWERRKIFAFGI